VVGLQGRFSEAETIARKELSQSQADTNVTYLRSMLSQQNSWAKLADKDKPAKSAVN
jgi:Flp pilus assembly protein TadD